jgi:hypothetical protein
MRNYFALADEISDMGIPIDTVYDCMPKTVCRHDDRHTNGVVSPANLKRTSPIRKKMIDYIFDCCSNNEYVNPKKLIEVAGISTKTITEEVIRSNYKPEFVDRVIGRKLRNAQSRRAALASDPVHKLDTPVKLDTKPMKQAGRDIVCDSAIRSVLTRIVAAGKAEDEYAALLYCIRLGAESLNPQP